jgi:hypothetical protein
MFLHEVKIATNFFFLLFCKKTVSSAPGIESAPEVCYGSQGKGFIRTIIPSVCFKKGQSKKWTDLFLFLTFFPFSE